METTTEFEIVLDVHHETNKQSYSQKYVFESYEELADWLRNFMYGGDTSTS